MAHAAVAAGSSAVDADDASFRLLSVSWNQDSSCFTAATTADFRVFSCAPFRESLRRVLPSGGGGGYAIVEMLFRSSLFALVAAGEAGRHRVELWDDSKNRRVGDITGIRSAVRTVRVSMARPREQGCGEEAGRARRGWRPPLRAPPPPGATRRQLRPGPRAPAGEGGGGSSAGRT